MKVLVGGLAFENFLSISVNSAMNELARSFELTAVSRGFDDVPFRKGQTVEVKIGSDRIFNGFLEKISLRMGQEGRTLTFSGRDRLADIIDSDLTKVSDIGETVEHACKAVIRALGLSPMKVIDLANTAARPFSKEIVAPEDVDTAFQFLSDVARRRQALLTSDGDANLVITQGIGQAIDGRLVNRIDQIGNNLVGDAEYSTDDSRRFGLYTTSSQGNPSSLSSILGPDAGIQSPGEMAGTSAKFRDRDIRLSRKRSISSEASYSQEDAKERARWEANLSRAEGILYRASVVGFHDAAGDLWRVNTAPIVEDQFAGLDTRMLLKGLTYRSDENGETTTLRLTERGAFEAKLQTQKGMKMEESDDDALSDLIASLPVGPTSGSQQ